MNDAGTQYRFLDGAAGLIAEIDAALESGEIDDAAWHARLADIVRPAYLAGATPQAQSGFSGGPLAWEQARGLIADGIDRDGTFLDVGCANGLLMETMVRWCAAKGIAIAPGGRGPPGAKRTASRSIGRSRRSPARASRAGPHLRRQRPHLEAAATLRLRSHRARVRAAAPAA